MMGRDFNRQFIKAHGDKFNIPKDAVKIYGGFWIRFLAYIADVCIIMIPVLMLSHIFTGNWLITDKTPVGQAIWSIGAIITWQYCTLFESSDLQATPGKLICNLKVTDLNGNKIGIGKANGRFWAKILSQTFAIGYIMIGLRDDKRGLHDLLAGTVVVER